MGLLAESMRLGGVFTAAAASVSDLPLTGVMTRGLSTAPLMSVPGIIDAKGLSFARFAQDLGVPETSIVVSVWAFSITPKASTPISTKVLETVSVRPSGKKWVAPSCVSLAGPILMVARSMDIKV